MSNCDSPFSSSASTAKSPAASAQASDSVSAATAEKPSLVLVGLMGAGKSTIGRRLAKRLGLPFADSDQEIEAAAGCTISAFFDRYGETAFREGERKVIARLLGGEPIVLATGGGAFMDEQTRALIKERARSIWLRADLKTLVERCSRRNTRPLLAGKDVRAVLRDLMEKREPIYAQADIHITTGDGPHEDVVDAIVEALDNHPGT